MQSNLENIWLIPYHNFIDISFSIIAQSIAYVRIYKHTTRCFQIFQYLCKVSRVRATIFLIGMAFSTKVFYRCVLARMIPFQSVVSVGVVTFKK